MRWVDKISELCNRSMKSWLDDNDIKIYSTNYTKNICKHITAVSKNVYIDKLEEIADKQNHAYQSIKRVKMSNKIETYCY